jgi:two-component system nitrate/nitrite response regulator NarL
MPRRIRVFTADRLPLYRSAVAAAIKQRPELELVGESSDGRETLSAIARLEPDVAVIDIDLPRLDGGQILNAVGRDGLESRILLLSSDPEPAVVYRSIAAGAAGYLSKAAQGSQICDAITAVARGRTVLSPELQTGIAGEIRLRAADERPLLTAREQEVLVLISEGLTAPRIGRRLHLSTATVKTHLQHLYEKLGVSERAAAVAEAMRRGLLE